MKERPYTGLTAEIRIGDVPLAYMSGVDLTLEKEIIEVLQFGAKYREKVPAIKNWSASVDGTVALAPGGSQHKLYQAFENDEEISIGIFLNDFVYFQGTAYVQNFNINGSPDDKMNITCDLEGNGAVLLELPDTYNIVANSGVGGTLTPTSIQVASKGSAAITIYPAAGYEVDSLTDNGEKKAISGNTYSLSNVMEDHKIYVAFKIIGGADKAKLQASIAFADTLTQSSYDPSKWSAMQTALTEAKTINGNVSATQEQVDEALDSLNTAIFDLNE